MLKHTVSNGRRILSMQTVYSREVFKCDLSLNERETLLKGEGSLNELTS